MKKECNVYLLDANNKGCLLFSNNSKTLFELRDEYKLGYYCRKHLYITSDEKIKDGDWCMNENKDTIYQKDKYPMDIKWKKIVATTNPDLWINKQCETYKKQHCGGYCCGVGKIGIDFVDDYIKASNKSKPITKVYLTYELDILTEPGTHDGNPCSTFVGTQEKLKLRPNSTVIISPVVEKLYNLDEIEELFYVYVDDYLNYLISNNKSSTKGSKHHLGFKKWFTEIHPK